MYLRVGNDLALIRKRTPAISFLLMPSISLSSYTSVCNLLTQHRPSDHRRGSLFGWHGCKFPIADQPGHFSSSGNGMGSRTQGNRCRFIRSITMQSQEKNAALTPEADSAAFVIPSLRPIKCPLKRMRERPRSRCDKGNPNNNKKPRVLTRSAGGVP
jgi:hypothetical protein